MKPGLSRMKGNDGGSPARGAMGQSQRSFGALPFVANEPMDAMLEDGDGNIWMAATAWTLEPNDPVHRLLGLGQLQLRVKLHRLAQTRMARYWAGGTTPASGNSIQRWTDWVLLHLGPQAGG